MYQVVLRLPMSRNHQNDKSNFYSAYGMTSGNVVSHPALVKKKRSEIYTTVQNNQASSSTEQLCQLFAELPKQSVFVSLRKEVVYTRLW